MLTTKAVNANTPSSAMPTPAGDAMGADEESAAGWVGKEFIQTSVASGGDIGQHASATPAKLTMPRMNPC
ncbi:hypothetical protein XPN_2977 [Xanthomonas arboricola pv. pruni MAFF 301427]|nr:hypothetical protein XPN_2977 [Xanthomonas arboricola pv. pruni MAFF 301427]